MAYRSVALSVNNPLYQASSSSVPRKAAVSDAVKADATNQNAPIVPTASDAVSFTEKAMATPETNAGKGSQSVAPQASSIKVPLASNNARRFSLAPVVTACGGILGTVLGGVGGYYVANFVDDGKSTTASNNTGTTTPINQSAKTLEEIEQHPVYLKQAGEQLVLNPDKLTATTNTDNHYYEFTPQTVTTLAPEATFDIIHHHPTQNIQVQYRYENPALVAGSTDPIKPVLKQITVLTPDGLNDCFTLNAKGQPISRVKTIKTSSGHFENHEWQFAFDNHNANRTVERHVIYPATPNASGKGFYTADDAVATSETVYEKIFNTAAGFLQEIQVLEKDGNAERLLFDAQGNVTERFEPIASIKAERLEKVLTAKAGGAEGWITTKVKEFKQSIQPDSPAEKWGKFCQAWGLDVLFNDLTNLERAAAQWFQDGIGTNKLTSKAEIQHATLAEAGLVGVVHPQTQLRTAIQQPAFSGGEPLFKMADIAWQQFKVAYKESGGAIVEQTVGDRFSSLTQAFKETSVGQKIGLGVGAILGCTLGIWALLPKKKKKPPTTVEA